MPDAEKEAHAATLHGERVVCTCGDFNCASLDYTACSFAIHKGGIDYCKGDVRFPETHATLCPAYSARVTPPDALLCPGDGCPGCFHCTSTNQGDDSDRATEPGRLVEPSNTASISRMEGATGAVGAPSPDAEVGAADGRVGRSRAREVARVLPPGSGRA